MRILISGASGFIGQHLVNLLAKDNVVYGASRRSCVVKSKATSIIVDLAVKGWSRTLPCKIDCVIHLAQSLRYRDFPEGVTDMQRINIDATVELLEWARMSGVQHFVFASTANVYAPSTQLLVETSPTIPDSFYGATKLAAEHLVRQYIKYFQVDILRLFTVFGPGQQNMLIANIIERIKTGKEVTLAEGVGIYLTPIFVDDVVNIIKKLISMPIHGESHLLNLCGQRVTSLCEIVKILELLHGQYAVTRIIDGNVLFFTGNNGQLRKTIGDYQFFDLQSGLERTLNFTDQLYSSNVPV